MSAKKNPALAKTIAELTETHEALKGKQIAWDAKRRLIMVDPHIISGLWPQCERLTFQAFIQVRTKPDWERVKDLCIRTPKTKFLHDLIKRRFARKKKKQKVK